MKKQTLMVLLLGGTIVVIAIGAILVTLDNIKTKLITPDIDYTMKVETVTPAPVDTVSDSAESEEPSSTTKEESELSKLFEDPKQLEANLGENQGYVEIDNYNYRGIVEGLQALMGSSSTQHLASAEMLLTQNLGHPILEVKPCTKKVPKYYAGDIYWLFEDDMGFVGELVVKDNVMYLYYYGDSEKMEDKILMSGFPATSYGELKPPTEAYDNNTLYEDLQVEDADKIMSALIDGECFSVDQNFYVVYQTSFEWESLFEEVKAFKINVDLSSTFVEVYVTDDRFYTIRTTNPLYEDIVPNRLLRNMEIEEVENSEEEENEESVVTIWHFRDSAIAEYFWDGNDLELCPAVSGISNETVAKSFSFALTEQGWEDCRVMQTYSLNGYTIEEGYLYAIQLPDNEGNSIDYYASVSGSSGTVKFYPADATPKL